jgi:intracellular septation protein A
MFKVWVILPLIFLFALAQTPLVLKHQVEENKTGADS